MQQSTCLPESDVKFLGSTRLTSRGCALFMWSSSIWGSCCFPPLNSLLVTEKKGSGFRGPGCAGQLQSPSFGEVGLTVWRWPSWCSQFFSQEKNHHPWDVKKTKWISLEERGRQRGKETSESKIIHKMPLPIRPSNHFRWSNTHTHTHTHIHIWSKSTLIVPVIKTSQKKFSVFGGNIIEWKFSSKERRHISFSEQAISFQNVHLLHWFCLYTG
jgi:hypothetical protein